MHTVAVNTDTVDGYAQCKSGIVQGRKW